MELANAFASGYAFGAILGGLVPLAPAFFASKWVIGGSLVLGGIGVVDSAWSGEWDQAIFRAVTLPGAGKALSAYASRLQLLKRFEGAAAWFRAVARLKGSEIGGTKNVAVAEAQVKTPSQRLRGAIYEMLFGVSGRGPRPGGEDLPTDDWLFSPTSPGGENHSEQKLLEKLARLINPNARRGTIDESASGEVVLYTERSRCFSCELLSEQFMHMFPNVKLTVIFSKQFVGGGF